MNLTNSRGPKKGHHEASSMNLKDATQKPIKFARIGKEQILNDLNESFEELKRLQERINRRKVQR